MEKKTLRELFESGQNELKMKITGLSLPKDSQKVQAIISTYMNEMFDAEGEYRQNLTQSEDYILRAALSLLNAQQEIGLAASEIEMRIKSNEQAQFQEKVEGKDGDSSFLKKAKSTSVNSTNAVIGSVGGAVVGNIIFGGWGAVFGALAGTAVTIYLAYRNEPSVDNTPRLSMAEPTLSIEETPIDVDTFCAVVSSICDSVDNLIATFRSQINKVVDKYENQEKPVFEKEYRFLLESIQTLLGYKRVHSPEEEKYTKKLQERIEDLAETLENYNLAVEDYNGENNHMFELVESVDKLEPKMAYPAIVKNGQAVLKGKVFIPKK